MKYKIIDTLSSSFINVEISLLEGLGEGNQYIVSLDNNVIIVLNTIYQNDDSKLNDFVLYLKENKYSVDEEGVLICYCDTESEAYNKAKELIDVINNTVRGYCDETV